MFKLQLILYNSKIYVDLIIIHRIMYIFSPILFVFRKVKDFFSKMSTLQKLGVFLRKICLNLNKFHKFNDFT